MEYLSGLANEVGVKERRVCPVEQSIPQSTVPSLQVPRLLSGVYVGAAGKLLRHATTDNLQYLRIHRNSQKYRERPSLSHCLFLRRKPVPVDILPLNPRCFNGMTTHSSLPSIRSPSLISSLSTQFFRCSSCAFL